MDSVSASKQAELEGILQVSAHRAAQLLAMADNDMQRAVNFFLAGAGLPGSPRSTELGSRTTGSAAAHQSPTRGKAGARAAKAKRARPRSTMTPPRPPPPHGQSPRKQRRITSFLRQVPAVAAAGSAETPSDGQDGAAAAAAPAPAPSPAPAAEEETNVDEPEPAPAPPPAPAPAPPAGDELSEDRVREWLRLPAHRFDPLSVPMAVGDECAFLALAACMAEVDAEASRLKIASVLANFFRALLAQCPSEAHHAAYMLSNQLAPPFEGVDLGAGGSTISRAVAEVTGSTRTQMRQAYRGTGDLGDVAFALRGRQRLLARPRPLRVGEVRRELLAVAAESGEGSVGRRRARIAGLLRRTRGVEIRYLVRILLQHIRLGATLLSVLAAVGCAAYRHERAHGAPALAAASGGDGEAAADGAGAPVASEKEAAALVRGCFATCPSLEAITQVRHHRHCCCCLGCLGPAITPPTLPVSLSPPQMLLTRGLAHLGASSLLRPGMPARPMLAAVSHGPEELAEKFAGVRTTCEYKYDGQRAQLHLLPGGAVRVFTRHLEDATIRFPDVQAIVREAAAAAAGGSTESAILDAEIVPVQLPPRAACAACAACREGKGGGAAQPCTEHGDGGGKAGTDASARRILPFQELSTRTRADVERRGTGVAVAVFAFDLLYRNGRPLLADSLAQRRQALSTAFATSPGRFEVGHNHWGPHTQRLRGSVFAAFHLISSSLPPSLQQLACHRDDLDTEAATAFLHSALQDSCEGLMVKALEGPGSAYLPGERVTSWLKVPSLQAPSSRTLPPPVTRPRRRWGARR